LRGQYQRLRTPAFLIGGLADGDRDSVPRMLDRVSAPVQALVGPWNHDFPDDGVPGPDVAWRADALAWFARWLRDDAGPAPARTLTLWIRGGDEGGHWERLPWPIPGLSTWRVETATRAGTRTLVYRPGTGMAGGDWWGEMPGDQRADDAAS